MAAARDFHSRSATTYGPVSACPAWMTAVPITRGPHFEWSGFGGQDEAAVDGNIVRYIGQSTVWDTRLICLVAREIYDDIRRGGDGRGFWWPHRSIPVLWAHDGDEPWLYKTGDEQLWDIGFWPLSLGLKTDDDFNRFLLPRQAQLRIVLARAEAELRLQALRAAARVQNEQRRQALLNEVEHFLYNENIEATRVLTMSDERLKSLVRAASVFQLNEYLPLPDTVLCPGGNDADSVMEEEPTDSEMEEQPNFVGDMQQ